VKMERETENTYTKLACSSVKFAVALEAPKESWTGANVAEWGAVDETQAERRVGKEVSGEIWVM
jgi:hypothetical protein